MDESGTTQRLLAAYDAQLRGWDGALPPGSWKEHEGPLLRVVGLHQGYLIGPRELGLAGAELDRFIARQRDYFAARGEEVEWKTHSHDLPTDLPDRLRAAGFQPEAPETVVIAEAGTVAAAADSPLPAGVALRQITSYPDLLRMMQMQSEVFGRDLCWRAEELARQIEAAPDETVVIVAESGEEMLCGARIAFEAGGEFAGLWGGATHSRWQGRGIYRAVLAARARLAVERGVRYVYVDASAQSAPILLRLGFSSVTTTTPYVWSPPA